MNPAGILGRPSLAWIEQRTTPATPWPAASSDAIASARQAIEDFQKVSSEKVLSLWFNARIDLHEASLLPGSMTKSLRREVYQKVSEELSGPTGKEPSSRILGGVLIQVIELLEDPIDGLPQELLQDASVAVDKLSQQHADNLFFALRAARLGIAVESPEAVQAVQRASQLAKAIEPSIRRETEPIGVTPDELVAQIVFLFLFLFFGTGKAHSRECAFRVRR